MKTAKRGSALLLAGLLLLFSVCAFAEQNTLILSMVTDTATSLNPLTCTNRDVLSLEKLVYESLVEQDDTGRPALCLAEDCVISEDGTTWTFTLRQNVRFHSGGMLTSADVVATYNAIIESKQGIWYAPLHQMVKSITAENDTTVTVTAAHTSFAVYYALQFPILPAGELSQSAPSGTGPYYFMEAKPGSNLLLHANDYWWKKQPEVKNIEVRNYASFDNALAQLGMNAVDMVATRSTAAARYRGISSYYGASYSTKILECMIPNLSTESPISDVHVRKAIMQALNKKDIITNAYLMMATQADACVSPDEWYYEPQAEIYDNDAGDALANLALAGWSDVDHDGILEKLNETNSYDQMQIRIITYEENDYPTRQDAANLIAEQLGEIGFDVTVDIMKKSDVLKAIKNGDYDLALVGFYLGLVPDYSFLVGTDGSCNLNGYSNPEMDAMLEAALYSVKEEQFRTALEEVQMHITDDLPILSLYFHSGSLVSIHSLDGLSRITELDTYNGLEYWNQLN